MELGSRNFLYEVSISKQISYQIGFILASYGG